MGCLAPRLEAQLTLKNIKYPQSNFKPNLIFMVLFNTDYPPAFHTQPRLFSKDRQHGDKVAEPLHSRGTWGSPQSLTGKVWGQLRTRGAEAARELPAAPACWFGAATYLPTRNKASPDRHAPVRGAYAELTRLCNWLGFLFACSIL